MGDETGARNAAAGPTANSPPSGRSTGRCPPSGHPSNAESPPEVLADLPQSPLPPKLLAIITKAVLTLEMQR